MTVSDLPGRPARRRPKLPKLSPIGLAAIAIVALLLAVAAFIAVVVIGSGAQTDNAATKQDTAPAVLTLSTLCARNDQLGSDLRAAGACGEKIDKAKSAVEGQPQPTVAAAGLSREDVTAIVAGQLAGKVVTVDQVMNMVTQVYNANRPKDAPPPTGDQVLAAVQSVCGTTKCQGTPGEPGKDAPAVTDEQLFTQVARYCSGEGAPCKGQPGTNGRDGVSFVRQYFARNDAGECHSYVVLSTGPDGIDSGAAGDAACPPLAPPTTPTG